MLNNSFWTPDKNIKFVLWDKPLNYVNLNEVYKLKRKRKLQELQQNLKTSNENYSSNDNFVTQKR